MPKGIYPRSTAQERFWEKVSKQDNGCWEWLGAHCSNGYGTFYYYNGHQVLAHRFAFELTKGEIPPKMELDHLCRNRGCVNPWHLEVVSHRDNCLVGVSPAILRHHAGRCQRGHSLVDAYRNKTGRVTNCRTCRREMRQVGLWR